MNSTIESPTVIGRAAERAEFVRALQSGRPELIAVYGRRRVGKTYLIRNFFAKHLSFELTGERDASLATQLRNFATSLGSHTGLSHAAPSDWAAAFRELANYLEPQLRSTKRRVIFFDELPWLAARRSGFLSAFEYFWNTWASRQPTLIVVICGSAASWMIAKVLNQRGGLHNRVTRSVPLRPFTLHETEAFLRARGIVLEVKQILELTMALGGVPYYLDHVRKGYSAAQNIDAIFFGPTAPLRDEFDKLFAALFDNHERHVKIIRALARKPSGVSRQELTRISAMPSGGNLSTILTELEASGFVMRTVPYGRTTRDSLYRLTDELTLFHLRWLASTRRHDDGAGYWQRIVGTPTWRAWSGYAFESVCMKHAAQLKSALGIAGVATEASTWYHGGAGDDRGAQIDLLIDRADDVINLCEIKFSQDAFAIDKRYADALRAKLATFRRVTRTRKSILLTFITVYGLASNSYSEELVQSSVTSDSLFAH
jgi:hypothetical protein